MTFLVDAQLPPALAAWLRAHGHEAQHVEDVGLLNAKDEPIWAHAIATATAILTKDEDFAERSIRDPNGPVIIWLRIGNASTRALLNWLEPRWSDVMMLLDTGHRLIEIR